MYPLETSTEETIDLPTIPTNKGTNIIEVDTSILPSNMEVKYVQMEYLKNMNQVLKSVMMNIIKWWIF